MPQLRRREKAMRAKAMGILAAGYCISSSVPATAGDQITIALEGKISPACTIANPNPLVDIGDVSKAGTVSLGLTVTCNSPFKFSFSSKNGGLLITSGEKAVPPFTTLVPYKLSYRLGTSDGFVMDVCSSSNMLSTQAGCAGYARAHSLGSGQNATLGFSWYSFYQIPLTGTYRDVVTVTVSAGL